jgi:hypothetical protein
MSARSCPPSHHSRLPSPHAPVRSHHNLTALLQRHTPALFTVSSYSVIRDVRLTSCFPRSSVSLCYYVVAVILRVTLVCYNFICRNRKAWCKKDVTVYLCQSGSGSRNIAVGLTTCYCLDDPVIESRWGARFPAHVQTGPGAYPPSYTVGSGSFPGVKWPRRGVDHPPTPSAEVKEKVELYLYSPSGPSWPIIG